MESVLISICMTVESYWLLFVWTVESVLIIICMDSGKCVDYYLYGQWKVCWLLFVWTVESVLIIICMDSGLLVVLIIICMDSGKCVDYYLYGQWKVCWLLFVWTVESVLIIICIDILYYYLYWQIYFIIICIDKYTNIFDYYLYWFMLPHSECQGHISVYNLTHHLTMFQLALTFPVHLYVLDNKYIDTYNTTVIKNRNALYYYNLWCYW